MIELLKLREHSDLAAEAAVWFHDKWQIPLEEYTESIQECLNGECVPQWYVVVEDERIIGGAGVIVNFEGCVAYQGKSHRKRRYLRYSRAIWDSKEWEIFTMLIWKSRKHSQWKSPVGETHFQVACIIVNFLRDH